MKEKKLYNLTIGDTVYLESQEISGEAKIEGIRFDTSIVHITISIRNAKNGAKMFYKVYTANDINDNILIVTRNRNVFGKIYVNVQDFYMLQSSIKQAKRQYKIDQRYLRMARIWSENSYCVRRQVGALLVKDRRIISDGYNGTPTGFPNVCEYIPNIDKPTTRDEIIKANELGVELHTHSYVLHAEANAITKIAKSNNSSEGATLYVTASPCMECSKLIIQSGIKRVVYSEEYRIMDGIKLLEKAGIECCYIQTDVDFEDSEYYKITK